MTLGKLLPLGVLLVIAAVKSLTEWVPQSPLDQADASRAQVRLEKEGYTQVHVTDLHRTFTGLRGCPQDKPILVTVDAQSTQDGQVSLSVCCTLGLSPNGCDLIK